MLAHPNMPSGALDIVVSNGVIDLIPDKDAVFAEIDRVLNPSGRLQIRPRACAAQAAGGQGGARGKCVTASEELRKSFGEMNESAGEQIDRWRKVYICGDVCDEHGLLTVGFFDGTVDKLRAAQGELDYEG